MDRRYIRDDIASSLSHAVEEAGEFLAAAGKTIRFGLFRVNPEIPEDQQEANIDWLQREMRDLRSSLNRLSKAMREERAKEARSQAIWQRVRADRAKRRGY